MHPDAAFAWDDRAEMRAFVAAHSFGPLAVTTPGGPRTALVPMLWDGEASLLFHLSRRNNLVGLVDGAQACFIAMGPHAYVSPADYALPDQVPTWNYSAVELAGHVSRLPDERLPALLTDLSATHERAVAPDGGWTMAQLAPARRDALIAGIAGFALTVTSWRGVRKWAQNKPEAARIAVAGALAARGDRAAADAMRAMLP